MSGEPGRGRSKAARVVSLCLLVLNVAGLLIMGPALGYYGGRLAEMYAELNASLPWLSRAMLGIPLLGHVAVGVGLSVLLIISEVLVKDKNATSALNIIVAVVLLVFLTLYVVGLMLPLPGLMQAANAA